MQERLLVGGTVPPPHGIRFGCLWGILVPVVYTIVFVGVLLLLPHEPFPKDASGLEYAGLVVKFLLLSVATIVTYVALLVPCLVAGLYLGVKDPSIRTTLKYSWPFLVAILYLLSPDLFPGPIDDAIVAFLLSTLGAGLAWNRYKKKDGRERAPQQEEEVIVVQEAGRPGGEEKKRPQEIIDVEYEEK